MEEVLRKNASLRELFQAIVLLDETEEAARFFRDLCTVSELEAMAERWQVARLIDQGLPYREISRMTGASTATISRIAQWLRHGEGGYRGMLIRIGREGNPDPVD